MEKRVAFKSRDQFRKWLLINCLQEDPVWIEFYKDGRQGISYKDALEEALSFGWIDSLIKKINKKIYIRKFSKRKKNSRWSKVNRTLAEGLIKKKLMTRYGLSAIEEAKKNGQWEKKDEREDFINIDGLREILEDIDTIKEFDGLTESLKKHYSIVYYSAKTVATRKKRLELIKQYMKTKKRFM